MKEIKKNDDEELKEKEIRLKRQNIIDSVIVRVMKARKIENYNQLLEDVTRQIKMFLAQPAMIEQRIESLIEKEFLKRDDDDETKFIYLP